MKLHIRYLLSLEDSPRSRAACIKYVQNWLGYFYPDRMDVVAEARELARCLGGELHDPKLEPKYAWMSSIIGYNAAKDLQSSLPALKWAVFRAYDRAVARLSRRPPRLTHNL